VKEWPAYQYSVSIALITRGYPTDKAQDKQQKAGNIKLDCERQNMWSYNSANSIKLQFPYLLLITDMALC
jgi:hypothetical protein